MEVVPREVSFATASLTGMNRNRYRLETNGATSAGPSSIITITMPSNALLDLKTFRITMDLLCSPQVLPPKAQTADCLSMSRFQVPQG